MNRERLAELGWLAARVEMVLLVVLHLTGRIALGLAETSSQQSIVLRYYILSMLLLCVSALLTFPMTLFSNGRERLFGAASTVGVFVLSVLMMGFSE